VQRVPGGAVLLGRLPARCLGRSQGVLQGGAGAARMPRAAVSTQPPPLQETACLLRHWIPWSLLGASACFAHHSEANTSVDITAILQVMQPQIVPDQAGEA